MSKTKRKRYSAEFKAKVAMEAIRGDQTLAELAMKFAIHPTMITNWKKQAVAGMVDVFIRKGARQEAAREADIKELHAKIGQLTVERDFLAKAFGR